MASLTASLSCVVVIESGACEPEGLVALSQRASEAADFSELIVVANGVNEKEIIGLKQAITAIPDCTGLVLGKRASPGLAQIAGLEIAIGDWILTAVSPGAADAALSDLPASLEAGYDLIVYRAGRGGAGRHRSWLERAAVRLLSWMSGLELARGAAAAVLSRDAAQQILSSTNAELLLRAGQAGEGFPAWWVDGAPAVEDPAWLPEHHRLGAALRLLVSTGAAPVRAVSVITLSASALAALYAVYVGLIFLFKPAVVPGWTSLSLQVSGMMFLLSLALALMSEYVAQIYQLSAGRRPRLVAREIRSPQTRRDSLNVTDSQGNYHATAVAHGASAGASS